MPSSGRVSCRLDTSSNTLSVLGWRASFHSCFSSWSITSEPSSHHRTSEPSSRLVYESCGSRRNDRSRDVTVAERSEKKWKVVVTPALLKRYPRLKEVPLMVK